MKTRGGCSARAPRSYPTPCTCTPAVAIRRASSCSASASTRWATSLHTRRLRWCWETASTWTVPIAQVRYNVFAAGHIYLRASDMARFLATQLNGGVYDGKRILSEASSLEMRRRQFDGQNYGLGTGMGENSGHDVVSHSGAIPGFNSISVGEPATGQGVYIMANSSQSAKAIGPIAQLAMRLMWGEDAEPLGSFASVEHEAINPSSSSR